MAHKKQAPVEAAEAAPPFTPDGMVIRSCAADGSSYNGFRYPLEVGAMVTCPDWLPTAACGNGLHGLLDGLGDWSLIDATPGRIWQVIGVLRSEVVSIDDDKVKFPRGVILYSGHAAGAITMIQAEISKGILAAVRKATGSVLENATTGYGSAAATTGDGSAAATTGDGSAAATTGYGSAAATTGNRSAASVKGKNSIAAALGPNGTAKAGEDGWIVLTAWDDDWSVAAVRAAKVGGPEGIKSDTWYRLTLAGEFEEVGA